MKANLPYIVSGFFLGVLLRSFLDWGWAFALFFVLLGAAFLTQKNFKILFLCFGVALGIARYEWKDNPPLAVVEKPGIPGIPGFFQAVVIDEPDERENAIRYVLEVRPREPKEVGPLKILAVSRLTPRFEYGDLVEMRGKIERVENFSDYDWQAHLARDEIYFESAFPTLSLIERGHGNWLREKLFAVKRAYLESLGRAIAEPEAALGGGLTVGAKQSLGKELLEKFRIAGLIHVVVLSGYNISIVALGVMWFLKKFLSQRASIALAVLTIIFFALMVGGGATVVRASVMATIALLAQATGRESAAARALVIAALIMIIWNPKVLVFDLGFELSFLATLGLIYLEPIARKFKFIQKLPERVLWLPVREVASATLAAQVAVFPLILYTFGNFSPYAFPVNILVLPLVPSAMLLVFLAGILGMIFAPLSLPFAWLGYLLLAYMITLVSLVSRLPLASLQFANVPLVLILLLYVAIAYFTYRYHKKEKGVGPALSQATHTLSF